MSDQEPVRVVRAARKTSVCRGCGKPVVWGVTPEGKKICLDPKPAVYKFLTDDHDTIMLVPESMVTHWATCSEVYKPKGSRAWEQPAAADPPKTNA